MTSIDFWLAVVGIIGGGAGLLSFLILRTRYKRREKDYD